MASPLTLRTRLYDILEKRDSDSRLGILVDVFLVLLILTNVLAVILESVKEINAVYRDFFFMFKFFR